MLGVIGTGKRTGKTAVAGHLATLLRERGVRAGGRLDGAGRAGRAAARAGRRAARRRAPARDLERRGARGLRLSGGRGARRRRDASAAGAAAEGPAGEVFDSNVVDGVRLALSLDPDAIVLEGSGASLPPVAAHRTVCVTRRRAQDALSGLGPLRLMRSDLAVPARRDAIDGALPTARAWCPLSAAARPRAGGARAAGCACGRLHHRSARGRGPRSGRRSSARASKSRCCRRISRAARRSSMTWSRRRRRAAICS